MKAGEALSIEVGSRLTAGRYAVLRGLLDLEFDNGAKLILEAPTLLELKRTDLVQLDYGKVVATFHQTPRDSRYRPPGPRLSIWVPSLVWIYRPPAKMSKSTYSWERLNLPVVSQMTTKPMAPRSHCSQVRRLDWMPPAERSQRSRLKKNALCEHFQQPSTS